MVANNLFSAKIQRRLASNIPPRPIVDVSFDDSYEYLNQLCQNEKEVYRVLIHSSGSSARQPNQKDNGEQDQCSIIFPGVASSCTKAKHLL